MVESVDTKDLKSFGQWWLCGFKSHFEYTFRRTGISSFSPTEKLLIFVPTVCVIVCRSWQAEQASALLIECALEMATTQVVIERQCTWVVTRNGNYSGGLSMTSFFNTNLSNLSNAMRLANLVSIRVIRGVFLTRIFRISRMQWGLRTWSAFV